MLSPETCTCLLAGYGNLNKNSNNSVSNLVSVQVKKQATFWCYCMISTMLPH